MSRLLLLALLFLASAALAQDGVVSFAETNRAEYAYGETIELRYTVSNESDETITLVASSGSTCPVGIEFGPLPDPRLCTTDSISFDFAPHSSRTWVWHIIPSEHGVPVASGEQTVTAFFGFNRFPATAFFTAPQYLGGLLEIVLADGVVLNDIQDILDALNGVVVYANTPGGLYFVEISGTTLEDAVATYGLDPRFHSLVPRRVIVPVETIYTVDDEDGASPVVPMLTAAHPNPFAVSTAFALTVPTSGAARVEVFDVLGRRVAVLHDGPLAAGPEHRFTFHAADLPSGLYVVRATGDGFSQTRRITLSR